jgi:hypothetical protein
MYRCAGAVYIYMYIYVYLCIYTYIAAQGPYMSIYVCICIPVHISISQGPSTFVYDALQCVPAKPGLFYGACKVRL